jgi:hypothetical protein
LNQNQSVHQYIKKECRKIIKLLEGMPIYQLLGAEKPETGKKEEV